MTDHNAEIVPFGKYRGQPVETLVADDGYRDWLMTQPWFRERFGNLYQVVINYGAEPQDSPEHNQMQVSFLDDTQCMQLARLLHTGTTFDTSEINYTTDDEARHQRFNEHLEWRSTPAEIANRTFETGGWDVVFSIHPAVTSLELLTWPDCECSPCDHSDCPSIATCRGGAGGLATSCCWHTDHAERRYVPPRWRRAHCDAQCPWSDEATANWLIWANERRWYGPSASPILVELKPDLGDDFPNVLRQVNNYDGGAGRRCVVVRRHQFERVTWEQVTQVFAASGIQLIREADLSDA